MTPHADESRRTVDPQTQADWDAQERDMPNEGGSLLDPARAFLSRTREVVIVWAHAVDVIQDGSRYTTAERGLRAWVGVVLEVHDWGLIVGSPLGSFWWTTRWDLIEWAGPRRAFP